MAAEGEGGGDEAAALTAAPPRLRREGEEKDTDSGPQHHRPWSRRGEECKPRATAS